MEGCMTTRLAWALDSLSGGPQFLVNTTPLAHLKLAQANTHFSFHTHVLVAYAQ